MIKHIKCDIFESGADVICHQVNCQGVMGSGIAKQVREKYPNVYTEYQTYCKAAKESMLGKVLIVPTEDGFSIANLFGQNNYGYDGNLYTSYDKLHECLEYVKVFGLNRTIAIPYLMGCYRGGGDWNVVYKMIEDLFGDSDCDILICEYNGG